MGTKTKKKLCWNCEGNVSLDNENCPYCGVSMDVSPMAGTDPNTFTSPFKPSTISSTSTIPKAPYAVAPEVKEAVATEEADFALSDMHRTLITLVSLSLGTILLIFGGILFLFSDSRGIFTLHWHGSYWYFYLLVGLPLIYFGWRTMSDFSSQDNNTQQ